MVLREYPEEIKKLMEMYEPYADRIHDGKLENAPPKVIEAFEKVKKWAWKQGLKFERLDSIYVIARRNACCFSIVCKEMKICQIINYIMKKIIIAHCIIRL